MTAEGIAVGLLLGPLALGFGGLMLYWGVGRLSAAGRAVLTRGQTALAEPISPGDAEKGYSVVTGRAKPVDALAAPLSGAEAVAYSYRIGQETDGVGWWQVAEGTVTGPFEVVGPTGRIRVEPGDGRVDVPTEPADTVRADGELLDRTRERLAASPAFDLDTHPEYLAGAVSDPRRYAEGVLEPGTEVYVYGDITRESGRKRVDGDESRAFAVTTDPISGLDNPSTVEQPVRTLLQGLVVLVIGVGFFALGALVLAALVAELVGLTLGPALAGFVTRSAGGER